jgi:hypothetical protein
MEVVHRPPHSRGTAIAIHVRGDLTSLAYSVRTEVGTSTESRHLITFAVLQCCELEDVSDITIKLK